MASIPGSMRSAHRDEAVGGAQRLPTSIMIGVCALKRRTQNRSGLRLCGRP